MASEAHQLWIEFGDRLRGFIARRVANEADAEDILQEVFLRLHQRPEAVQRADHLTAWLFTVTRNAIADHYRRPAQRRELVSDATVELAVDQSDPATQTAEAAREATKAHEELAGCLRPMVARLPAPYRDAIILVDLEGITQREAAERLTLSVSGMKSRVQRGRRSLRTMLDACCRLELDARGQLTDYEARAGSCSGCGGQSAESRPVGEPSGAGECCRTTNAG